MYQFNATPIVFESLALFDTSKTRQLELINSSLLHDDLPYQALLPMKSLRTLTISRCHNLSSFLRALDPERSNVLICPKLKKLVLCIGGEMGFDVQIMVNMVAARASRGAELKSIRIASQMEFPLRVVLELGKHALRVDYDSEVDSFDNGDDDSDGED
ncbi:hypothetical protein BDM02DRAFT_3123737 [Thelephora ganbajun]|uniref:Uncharacterized protein n=1 Tax=Thelephora ganbajun TaxID=370292 RepID=A0ACB6Z107_THEGA|nr:hypothetical protein BDM02DRAFT_3123737 [Thelephora ganbajun]